MSGDIRPCWSKARWPDCWRINDGLAMYAEVKYAPDPYHHDEPWRAHVTIGHDSIMPKRYRSRSEAMAYCEQEVTAALEAVLESIRVE